jgi:hypothetical protein
MKTVSSDEERGEEEEALVRHHAETHNSTAIVVFCN